MPTHIADVLVRPPSGRAVPLILDHASFGSARLLHGSPVPWSTPVECLSYFDQAQGLLRPDATLVDVGAAYEQHLAGRPDLVAAMSARSRTGYALKTLLADQQVADAVAGVVQVLAQTSRLPIVLQLPAPLRWLALTSAAAGNGVPADLTVEHGESASMYLADWLRRVGSLPVALLLLDGRRHDDKALAEVVADDLASCTPVVNACDHYRWGLGLRRDDWLELHGSDVLGVVLPKSFWVDGQAPPASLLLGEVPADAEPGHVLERLASLA
jgi:hypothetical protein